MWEIRGYYLDENKHEFSRIVKTYSNHKDAKKDYDKLTEVARVDTSVKYRFKRVA